uniref:DNA-directed RNA polymerase subunit beta' n=1 Tax=Schizomeris leibleinii TaxID=104533 RepID=F8SY97_9CHLO|nr:beta' subunit of RNA polymerase [Schizomeris leibleinii]AEH05395.1 beta' subunit of RNA polymerase [Schizomeris leibleinii]
MYLNSIFLYRKKKMLFPKYTRVISPSFRREKHYKILRAEKLLQNSNTNFSKRFNKKFFFPGKKSFFLIQKASSNINPLTFQNPSRFDEIKLITIGLASPDRIRQWAETILPNETKLGQVYNANTLHHKTLKPLKGGLFCERIFGPTKDFQCACGIQKEKPVNRIVTSMNRQFCSKCNVEYTWSMKRRYQLGYIKLVLPVTHLWYLKSSPSFIAVMLDMKRKDLESLIYCSEILTIDVAWQPGKKNPFFFGNKEKLVKTVKNSKNISLQKKLKPIKIGSILSFYNVWWRFFKTNNTIRKFFQYGQKSKGIIPMSNDYLMSTKFFFKNAFFHKPFSLILKKANNLTNTTLLFKQKLNYDYSNTLKSKMKLLNSFFYSYKICPYPYSWVKANNFGEKHYKDKDINTVFSSIISWEVFWNFSYKLAKSESIKKTKKLIFLLSKLRSKKYFLQIPNKNSHPITPDFFIIKGKSFGQSTNYPKVFRQCLSYNVPIDNDSISMNLKYCFDRFQILSETQEKTRENKMDFPKVARYSLENQQNVKINDILLNSNAFGEKPQSNFAGKRLFDKFCFNRVSFKLFIYICRYLFKKCLTFTFFSQKSATVSSKTIMFNKKMLWEKTFALIQKLRNELTCWKLVQELVQNGKILESLSLQSVYNSLNIFSNVKNKILNEKTEVFSLEMFFAQSINSDFSYISNKKFFSKIYKYINYWYKEELFLQKNLNPSKLIFGFKTEKLILLINFFLKVSHQKNNNLFIRKKVEFSSSQNSLIVEKTFKNFSPYILQKRKIYQKEVLSPLLKIKRKYLKNCIYQRELLYNNLFKIIQKFYSFSKNIPSFQTILYQKSPYFVSTIKPSISEKYLIFPTNNTTNNRSSEKEQYKYISNFHNIKQSSQIAAKFTFFIEQSCQTIDIRNFTKENFFQKAGDNDPFRFLTRNSILENKFKAFSSIFQDLNNIILKEVFLTNMLKDQTITNRIFILSPNLFQKTKKIQQTAFPQIKTPVLLVKNTLSSKALIFKYFSNYFKKFPPFWEKASLSKKLKCTPSLIRTGTGSIFTFYFFSLKFLHWKKALRLNRTKWKTFVKTINLSNLQKNFLSTNNIKLNCIHNFFKQRLFSLNKRIDFVKTLGLSPMQKSSSVYPLEALSRSNLQNNARLLIVCKLQKNSYIKLGKNFMLNQLLYVPRNFNKKFQIFSRNTLLNKNINLKSEFYSIWNITSKLTDVNYNANEKWLDAKTSKLSNIFFLKTKTRIVKNFKKSNILYNNLYCLSHRFSWGQDLELQTFLNYMSVPIHVKDVSIKIYKHRLIELLNLRQPPPVIAGGLVQKLLSEFNPSESKKIIQQILKQIRKVNNLLIRSISHTESRKYRQKRTFLLRRLKYIHSVSYKFSEDYLYQYEKYEDGKSKNFSHNGQNTNDKKSPKKLSKTRNILAEPNAFSQKMLRSSSFSQSNSTTNLNKNLKMLLPNNLRSILKESRPEWMVLSVLPVLPPDLRPIIQIQNQVAASDLNRLYQKVIYRNERLKRFLKDSASSNSPQMKFAYRLLQEAVDNLIDNGKGKGNAETDNRGRPLKSLSELLKGKRGRFRQNLLGKRVDYSGRSVIVVGPRLRLHECGLPKEMALELFMPFLIQKIFKSGKASTILAAKKILQNDPNRTWDYLTMVMRENPILLNRAPTLHRLGFQAFQPKLVEGRAILLHPLVCPAFNADFDGDQMAVHVPITIEAKVEAWKIMLATNHLLSSATGEAMLVPSQDMVLGTYYLTANVDAFTQPENSKSFTNFIRFSDRLHNIHQTSFFSNIDQVLQAYESGKIQLHSNIWLKWNSSFEIDVSSEKLIEIQLNINGNYTHIFSQFSRRFDSKGKKIIQYIQTTPGRVLFYSLLNIK